MSTSGTVVLRRTWPQRFVILFSLAIIAAALVVAWFINDVFLSISEVGRVQISGEILLTDTVPGEPVNFLLIGEDSAVGLDPDDPAAYAREVDPRGRFQADSITIVRVDPTSGQAWLLSTPRDLLIDDRGTQRRINSLLLVEGPERLVEAITVNFGITINHYLSLDFLGFRRVVDDLDGIPVWFDNPARDTGSGLDIPTPGCRVLDGVQSLQYVRARNYQELIDGRWTTLGNSDFGRIERQQDFLVLALDRAISRGARNPTTLAALIEAGATSIVLDSELSVAELIVVGEAFSDFNPENLQRFGLEVTTEYDSNDRYLGELLKPDRNEGIFDIFRGVSDLPAPAEVTFDLYASSAIAGPASEQFGALGFVLGDTFVVDAPDAASVIVYPTGGLGAAETLARWLEPIPRLVEDPDSATMSLVLGRDHEQILFLFPHEIPKMRAGVAAAQNDSDVPDLSSAQPADTSTSTPTTSAPPTTTVAPVDETPATTTTAGIIGRAPEGETCG
jgi:polyisoprenyl-teichoic acid--peptidoglycan teichoic acid transferase